MAVWFVTTSRLACLLSEANYGHSEMTKTPPPPVLPERKLRRVLALSRANSLGVLLCSGAALLLAALNGDWMFAGFSALAVVAGGMEAHGHRSLLAGRGDGLTWLIGAQACLYTVIVGYVIWRWRHFNPAAYWAGFPAPAQEQMIAQMKETGLDPEADRDVLLRMMNFLICSTLLGVSTLYQGGLALWYRLQRGAVLAALENPSTDESRAG